MRIKTKEEIKKDLEDKWSERDFEHIADYLNSVLHKLYANEIMEVTWREISHHLNRKMSKFFFEFEIEYKADKICQALEKSGYKTEVTNNGINIA